MINALYKTHHIVSIHCIRWDQKGERLASASHDGTVKVLDFASGEVMYTEKSVDGCNLLFLILLLTYLIIR